MVLQLVRLWSVDVFCLWSVFGPSLAAAQEAWGPRGEPAKGYPGLTSPWRPKPGAPLEALAPSSGKLQRLLGVRSWEPGAPLGAWEPGLGSAPSLVRPWEPGAPLGLQEPQGSLAPPPPESPDCASPWCASLGGPKKPKLQGAGSPKEPGCAFPWCALGLLGPSPTLG